MSEWGHEIDGYLGRFVRVMEPQGPALWCDDRSATASLPKTRDVDLSLWVKDAPNWCYRRLTPGIKTQTDLRVDSLMIAQQTLYDAALTLEFLSWKYDADSREYYRQHYGR